MDRIASVYDYIDAMCRRPGMFTTGGVAPLEFLLHGYQASLEANGITESHTGRKFSPKSFNHWLFESKGWSVALGFAEAIERHASSNEEAVDLFFSLVEEFRISEE